MNMEMINEMIERQDVYEIKYKKNEDFKTMHISNIVYSPKLGNSYILAYCHEACKVLTFNTEKILSIHKYWIGILSKNATAPNDGIYLFARVGQGQEIDMEYELLALKQGDNFIDREGSWDKPIAYHYIPSFGKNDETWIDKEIIMKKWVDEKIPSPQKGIPIIAYQMPQKEKGSKEYASIEYCIGVGGKRVWHGVHKNDDITIFFKEWDCAGPCGWSEHWDGYKILGFMIVHEYDLYACHQHIKARLKIEPDFFDY